MHTKPKGGGDLYNNNNKQQQQQLAVAIRSPSNFSVATRSFSSASANLAFLGPKSRAGRPWLPYKPYLIETR
jgi:hypothetical protein